MSACLHSVLGNFASGIRRASPRIESTSGSSASARSRLVPTFPLAPTTTTRMAPRAQSPWRSIYPRPGEANEPATLTAMAHDHHGHVHTDDARRLTIALVLILALMVAEVVAGVL